MGDSIKLTDSFVRNIKPPTKGYVITFDNEVTGFGCRVTAGGAKAFIFNYRVRATGRERRITLGRYPAWSVAAARDKAKALRRAVDDGGDPLGALVEAREAPTVADLIDRFIDEHLPRKRPGTAINYSLLLKNYVRPAFKHLKVTDVTFTDIDALHRQVTKQAGPYAANRMVGVLAKMFALAMRWGMRDDNPARGIERNAEIKRKRYLSGDELARLTAALAAHPDKITANIVRLLLLTGARRGEVQSMRWADLDLDTGIWTKLAATTKQKGDHTVPLSAPARQLLSEIAAGQKKPLGTFVFPSDSASGHVTGVVRAWRRLCKEAKLTNLRPHDLRHSFASQLVSSGSTLPLIGALLGHSNPTTTARYAHLFVDPQRAAVERVAAIVGNAGKIAKESVPFQKGERRGRR